MILKIKKKNKKKRERERNHIWNKLYQSITK
jgi:hypothetical protein